MKLGQKLRANLQASSIFLPRFEKFIRFQTCFCRSICYMNTEFISVNLLALPVLFVCLFFFQFLRWAFGYCGHYWPTVPAPDDRSWWLRRNWWNEDWQGKPKYSEKTCPSATLSTTNPTWLEPGLNPGHRGGKPATNRLSYGAAFVCLTYSWCKNTYIMGDRVYPSTYSCPKLWWNLESLIVEYKLKYVNEFTSGSYCPKGNLFRVNFKFNFINHPRNSSSYKNTTL
jgi:hypothetical protein